MTIEPAASDALCVSAKLSAPSMAELLAATGAIGVESAMMCDFDYHLAFRLIAV